MSFNFYWLVFVFHIFENILHNIWRIGLSLQFNIIVLYLQNRGVFGNFTLIEEFACDLFPFDSDLMSMELESTFKVRNVVHISAWCTYVMFNVWLRARYLILTIKRKSRLQRVPHKVIANIFCHLFFILSSNIEIH